METKKQLRRIAVTGGAGYVGAVLVPRLLNAGYEVTVLDLFLFGDDVLRECEGKPGYKAIRGDLRDPAAVKAMCEGCDGVIHLACISNDPSFELNPELGKEINFDAFEPLVDISIQAGVKRFIYASSSSVYGVSDAPSVDENHELKPLTDYSKFKAMCEPILLERKSADFTPVIVRPATVCGCSPRQRLDLIVNILTNHAVNNRRIRVFGGDQKRPNLHIEDMIDVYQLLLELPAEAISGKIYNVGRENHKVHDLASLVKREVEGVFPDGDEVGVAVEPTDDPRSYHISSEKIKAELGYSPRRSIEEAVRDLAEAFRNGAYPNPMEEARYYNIKTMKSINLQ